MDIEQFCFSNFINPNDVVYDLGAHVGQMSATFANRGAKIVYAFEPSSLNINDLKRNVSQYSNIIPFEVALHEKSYSCVTRFKDCADSRKAVPLDSEQSIRYVVLEDFINENKLEMPNFMKVDIEGMESIVLKTFDFIFSKSRPIIYLEVHAAGKGQTPQDYPDNPHWRWPDEGGYDLNKLKSFNYSFINQVKINEFELVSQGDFNPNPGDHKGRILIPNERIPNYIHLIK